MFTVRKIRARPNGTPLAIQKSKVPMKNKLIFPLIFVVFGVACGGDDGARRGSQQSYEVVQEGSASGVTSTIQGPGETLPPLTGTNADTTTAFSIDPNAVAGAPVAQQTPGTLAGAMPSYPPPMTSSTTRPPVNYTPPAQQAQPVTRMPSSQPRTQPAPSYPPQQEPAQQPPPATDTTVTTQPPTNTAPPPTQTAPQQQPQPKEQPKPQQQQEAEPEEEEEEEAEEPPPPTTTDTRGQ